jgi:hypothetical protein
MKMVAVILFETSVSTRATTQPPIPEDRACHQSNSFENLKYRELTVIVRKEMVLKAESVLLIVDVKFFNGKHTVGCELRFLKLNDKRAKRLGF